ncbi:MAG: metallophosphoesterase [Planctomycetota bacterium]
MARCYFVSDLHLFARRSEVHRYLEEIEAKARGAEMFILGGDIFDFHWTTMRSVGHAVEEAVRWLETLAADCPLCDFHFLLGNHDYHQGFIDRLADLESRVTNLSWHRYYFRHGVNMFLHGDVADRPTTAEMLSLRRARWLHRKARAPVWHHLYDLVIAAQLHRPVPYMVYPRRRVARRILSYLCDIGQGPDQGVRHVYFGHIHRTMADYSYGGLMFHNGGAPIKGTRFRVVDVASVD